MIKKSKFFPFLIIILVVFLTTCATYSADDFLASNVKDISDRNYEEAVIHLMPSNRTLHDKLIVVDSRYVVEGSANWSISALRANFESSTLIDSPGLARAKLARLENILIISKPDDKKTYTPAYIENLPKSLIIPKGLISNKEYFPNMVTRYDNRPLDLYLLLLAHSQAINKREFFISLETMALSLDMPRSWDDTA